jgi:phage-related protein
MFTIHFFEDHRGEQPALKYLNALPKKFRGKAYKWFDKLEREGNLLPRPYADFLEDGIYELRVRLGSDNHRFFYFFFIEKEIILTHGCARKDLSNTEIERAKRYRNEFLTRYKNGEFKI